MTVPTVSSITNQEVSFFYTISEKPDADAFILHCHDDYEVYLFVSGEGHYLIEGSRYELSPYSLGIIRPGEVHCYRSTGSARYERYVINFSPGLLGADPGEQQLLLEPFLDREPGCNNFYNILNDRSIIRIYNELTCAASLTGDEQKLHVHYLLGMLLTKIRMMYRYDAGKISENSRSALVADVLRFINDNLSERLTLDDIAGRFYVSKYHLSRTFKSLTGVSVFEYLIRKRIFLAQQMLKDGATAADACAKSGFGEYTSFYRAFKRIVGCSPLEVREIGSR